MEQKKKTAKIWLFVSVVLLLISMVGASLVQTSGGGVDMRRIVFETNLTYPFERISGHITGWLFVPDTATFDNPAPAVVVTHGMFNNRAMQDLNFVELSRRGFVVFAMDMLSHGDSSLAPSGAAVQRSMDQAVQMIARLNYVDSTRIGITGHSMGGMASNNAVILDNERVDEFGAEPLIRAVLINSANGVWSQTVDDQRVLGSIYRNRHVGIIAPVYEEFFMMYQVAPDVWTSPVDFMQSGNAQTFLNFGMEPPAGQMRTDGNMYRQTIDGVSAIRVIYNPPIIHPWAHFSQRATYATIEFFEEALGAPNPISPSNQVWQWKVVFNTIGLVGIFMFLVNFVILMVYTKFFSSLRAEAEPQPGKTDKLGKIWYFGLMAVSAAFATLIYLPVLRETGAFPSTNEGTWMQTQGYGIASWAVLNGLMGLVLMALFYFFHGRKTGFSLKEKGVLIGPKTLCKTLVLVVLSLTAFFGILFAADYFFMVDFRIWTVALRPFTAIRLLGAFFPFMLFFVVYFVVNSISATSFGYNDIGRKKWVNMLIFSVANVLPAIILLSMQYISFVATGWLFFGDHANAAPGPYHMFVVWLFPFLVILSVTPIIARKIYKATNNPYLPGVINGVIVTMMAAANPLTWLPPAN